MDEKVRCSWAGNTALYMNYHDNEWGRPVHDDNRLFEMLLLECMQAGLSWITILKKREAYREAFDGFDPEKVARYGDVKFQQLMLNAGIVRNRLKILAAINNAQAFLDMTKKHGSFNDMLWKYVDHTPLVGHWETIEDIPATTPLSDAISKDLKKRGFQFIGSTTIYAFMQAVGMVNDHVTTCFIYREIKDLQVNASRVVDSFHE